MKKFCIPVLVGIMAVASVSSSAKVWCFVKDIYVPVGTEVESLLPFLTESSDGYRYEMGVVQATADGYDMDSRSFTRAGSATFIKRDKEDGSEASIHVTAVSNDVTYLAPQSYDIIRTRSYDTYMVPFFIYPYYAGIGNLVVKNHPDNIFCTAGINTWGRKIYVSVDPDGVHLVRPHYERESFTVGNVSQEYTVELTSHQIPTSPNEGLLDIGASQHFIASVGADI